MTKSVICIICAFSFMIINTIFLFFKEDYSLFDNDENKFYIYYSKKVSNLLFTVCTIFFLMTIYYAISFNYLFSYILLFIDFIGTICYSIINYKVIYVCGDEIEVANLFIKNYSTKISNITKATYYPNAKIIVNLKRKQTFSVSFNSVNFKRFYDILLQSDVKFITATVPISLNHVNLLIYDMQINFPKTMFKENYQNKYFLRNAQYIFSARSIENKEFIEGYIKNSNKPTEEFVDIVKTDLYINDFKTIKDYKINIDGRDFAVIKSFSQNDSNIERLAYIYNSGKSYLILYMDFLKCNEDEFISKIDKSIKKI